MKFLFVTALFASASLISFQLAAQTGNTSAPANTNGKQHLYIDVHQLEPGKVKFEAVAQAHAKDLAVEGKYGVHF